MGWGSRKGERGRGCELCGGCLSGLGKIAYLTMILDLDLEILDFAGDRLMGWIWEGDKKLNIERG